MKRIIIFIICILYLSCSNYEGVDITKPSASINSPFHGEIVSDTLKIIGSGFDDIAVNHLELWINNENTGLIDEDSPFEFYIDTHTYDDGMLLEIAVRAYDTSENESQLSLPVEVMVDNNSPNPVILNAIISEENILHFSWSKCLDLDFYGYVIMYGQTDSNHVHYNTVDTIFNVDTREITENITGGEGDDYFSILVLDLGLKGSFSNAVRPVTFEYHTIFSGYFSFGEGNSDSSGFMQDTYQIMTTEVTNLQYSEFLNVANQLGIIDNNIGPWVTDSEGNILYNLEDGKITWDGYLFKAQNDVNANAEDPTDYNDHPVTYVSWFGANSFAEFFNFRLPKEKEWEKAARAGNSTDYAWGNYIDPPITNTPNTTNANYLDSGDPCEFEMGESDCAGSGTTPVGDPWFTHPYGGLYDMAGNVWEWVTRNEDMYESVRMYRGGSWKSPKQDLRCWVDDRYLEPHMMGDHIGFRCVK